jgi:hypothetical protein
MQNRNARPSLNVPRVCPKCQGFLIIAATYHYGQYAPTWACTKCGLNGESESYADCIHNLRRPIDRPAPAKRRVIYV